MHYIELNLLLQNDRAVTMTGTKAVAFLLLVSCNLASSFSSHKSSTCSSSIHQRRTQYSAPKRRAVKLVSLASSSGDDDDFMASLRSRMDQVNEAKLPLVVLDAMLPRQVLKINVNDPIFMDLVKNRVQEETPFFGMLGMARLKSGEQVHLRDGVVVVIIGKPKVTKDGLQIQMRAGKRFRIGAVEDAPQGWTQASVEYIEDDEDEEEAASNELDRVSLARAMVKARKLDDLVEEWLSLASTRERAPGQMDAILADLGEMPELTQPTSRAFWVGALVNPIPAMGVALEIRPALLTAKTAEDRIDVALEGIQRSILYMQGKSPLIK
jgi:Lon protease-like protein